MCQGPVMIVEVYIMSNDLLFKKIAECATEAHRIIYQKL